MVYWNYYNESKEIESIQYLFVLSKHKESDKYLAYDMNLTVLIDKINEVVNK